MKAQAGFGHFELFWILLAVTLATVSIRFAGWILGVDIGWTVCILFGLIAPVGLMMIIGVVVSLRHSPLDNATDEQPSTSNGDYAAVAPFKDAPSGQAAQCVQIVQDEEGKRRVRIFLRDTGTFYFQEENFSDHPLENSVGFRSVVELSAFTRASRLPCGRRKQASIGSYFGSESASYASASASGGSGSSPCQK